MIRKIENFLTKTNEQKAVIDISNLNLIDALKTAILFSTKSFIKFPEKKICWSVKDEETKKNNFKFNAQKYGIRGKNSQSSK